MLLAKNKNQNQTNKITKRPVNNKPKHLIVKARVQNIKDRRLLGNFTIVYTIRFPKDSK